MGAEGGSFLLFLVVATGFGSGVAGAVTGASTAAGFTGVTTTGLAGLLGASFGVGLAATTSGDLTAGLFPVNGSICQRLLSVIVSVLQPVRTSELTRSNLR